LIEPLRDPVEVGVGEGREIGSFREVLAQQTVGVFVGAALPRTARIAEIDPHIGGNGEALMGSQSSILDQPRAGQPQMHDLAFVGVGMPKF
jgi:hypothetical protein